MFRNDDIEKINLNINKIKNEAAEIYKNTYEPTINEISEVFIVIKNYIIKRKRIIYGGYAQNLLIKKKNPEGVFYKEINGACYNWPDLADIEFYSNDPFRDVIELTEELHSLNFKHVEGKQGVHDDTFKIFVNFINYCDITFMTDTIYNSLPIIIVDDIKCAHPHFMMVDAYRIFTDPMTSYWRLDKTISRFQKLIINYPINTELAKTTTINLKKWWNPNIINIDILNYIRNKIITNSQLIIVGFYAYDYYIKKQNHNDMMVNYPYYELISSDFSTDALNIYKLLKEKFKNINVKEYFAFISFIDKRIEYYYNNNLVLILYSNNNRCTVYNYSKINLLYIGTFSLVLMYILFNYFYYYIKNNNKMVDLYNLLISKLYFNRNEFLNNNNLTVMDNSPFQEFTFKCFGFPVDQLRQSFLEGLKKKKLGKKIKYTYTPTGKIKEMPKLFYEINSGNQIFSKNNLTLKNI